MVLKVYVPGFLTSIFFLFLLWDADDSERVMRSLDGVILTEDFFESWSFAELLLSILYEIGGGEDLLEEITKR